jgi:DNA-binding NarL/FixJ family response regulator
MGAGEHAADGAPDRPGQAARTIVVVEDDDAFRDLLIRMLRSWGYDVVGEAATVAEALARTAELRPEVVLADIGLPDGDGFNLTAALVRLDPPPSVVLISSDGEPGNFRAATRVGALGFVPKSKLDGDVLWSMLATPGA